MPWVALILEYGLKYGPDAIIAVRKLLSKQTPPTDAEWAELDAILQKTGASYFDPKVQP